MHLAVTGFLLCFFVFGTNSAYLQRNTCSVSATPACSYDRSRIKHSDIFSRNIRSREIEAKSDKPARIFLLLFSLFLEVTRIRRTRIRHFIKVGGTRSPLFLLLHNCKSRFSSSRSFRRSFSSFSKLCGLRQSASAPVCWFGIIFDRYCADILCIYIYI